MILKRTVLVLGAGASKPYDLPVGSELVNEICGGLRRTAKEFAQDIRACGVPEGVVREFGRALASSHQDSIDAFLQHRLEFIEVGKLSIARALIPHEIPDYIHRTRPRHWYAALLNVLDAEHDYFPSNQVSVITFNYDRSLEYFLFTALQSRYGLPSMPVERRGASPQPRSESPQQSDYEKGSFCADAPFFSARTAYLLTAKCDQLHTK